jgi:hypothetical protein
VGIGKGLIMMLSLVALLLFITSSGLYWWSLHAGLYRRVPWEHYALLGASAAVSLYALSKELSWWSAVVFITTFSALVLLIGYVHFISAFKRRKINLEIGERFPEFTLPDSLGCSFASSRMFGEKSVLYLFYRGNW